MNPEATAVRLDCFQTLALGLALIAVGAGVSYLVADHLDQRADAAMEERLERVEAKVSWMIGYMSDAGDGYLNQFKDSLRKKENL